MEKVEYEELYGLETFENGELTSIEEHYDKESLANDLIHFLLEENDETTDMIKIVKITRAVDVLVDDDEYETLKTLKIDLGK